MIMNAGEYSPEQEDPEFSVRMSTPSGSVYLAEFRTHGEAIALAREAADRLDTTVMICRWGEEQQEVVPQPCAARV